MGDSEDCPARHVGQRQKEAIVKRFMALLTLLALGISLAGLVGAGQETVVPCGYHQQVVYRYQYAVKVIQGKTPGPFDGTTPLDPLSPGLYFTSVNIHSPWSCQCVCFRVKLTIAGHFGSPGPITKWFYPRCLIPDGVTEYDGEDFALMLQFIVVPGTFNPNFYEGYFVIESEDELDVVGVYTVTSADDPLRQPVAMHQERVPARRIEICMPFGKD
jgi:hypothetical protein